MKTRPGRQEQIPFLVDVTVESLNEIFAMINRLFDGILGRGTQANTPQFVRFKIVTSPPTFETIEEGEVVLYEAGSTRRLYTKLNGVVRYTNLV